MVCMCYICTSSIGSVSLESPQRTWDLEDFILFGPQFLEPKEPFIPWTD